MDSVVWIIAAAMVGFTWFAFTNLLFHMGDYYKSMNKAIRKHTEKDDNEHVFKV